LVPRSRTYFYSREQSNLETTLKRYF